MKRLYQYHGAARWFAFPDGGTCLHPTATRCRTPSRNATIRGRRSSPISLCVLMPASRPFTLAAFIALALCAGHAPAAAQRLPPRPAEIRAPAPAWPGRAPLPAPAASQTDSARSRPDYLGMVGGGLVGAAIGGGAVYLLARGSTRSLGADVVAGMVGGMVAIPIGVHLGNRGRGSLGPTILASLGAGLGTLFLGAVGGEAAEPLVLGAPVAALAGAVFAEGWTTR